MSHTPKKVRFLNLLVIRLPLPGVVSILHRASGMLLVIALPLALYALDCSLSSEAGYKKVAAVFAHPLVKLMTIGVIWSLSHHFCAGIRYLLLDFHIGIDLQAARFSSVCVLVAGAILTVFFGAWLW